MVLSATFLTPHWGRLDRQESNGVTWEKAWERKLALPVLLRRSQKTPGTTYNSNCLHDSACIQETSCQGQQPNLCLFKTKIKCYLEFPTLASLPESNNVPRPPYSFACWTFNRAVNSISVWVTFLLPWWNAMPQSNWWMSLFWLIVPDETSWSWRRCMAPGRHGGRNRTLRDHTLREQTGSRWGMTNPQTLP